MNPLKVPELSRHSEPDPTSEFGRVICERSARFTNWALFVLAALPAIFFLSLGVFTQDRWTWLIAGAFFSYGAYYAARQALTSIRFHELAAVRRILGKTTIILYTEATSLTYRLVRTNIHGIPVGTTVTIKLAADKRKISFAGTHKTRKGSQFFGIKARVDELDELRDHISTIIADHLGDTLLRNEPVTWGPATLHHDGLVPRRGKYKRQLIPYAQIDRQSAASGWYSLFRKGDKRRFLAMPMATANFWPCLALFSRMVAVSQPSAAEVPA